MPMAAVAMSDYATLLNFNENLDVALLDNVVQTMQTGSGEAQMRAQSVLTTLKEHPDAWTRVDAMLEYAQSPLTKFYALQILEHTISTRWKTLPREQQEGIKNYVVGMVIRSSQDDQCLQAAGAYINKLNMVLVQILKQEWPHNWPTFIREFVQASKMNETLCQNNMAILQLLSEEVFDFSSGQMTQAKAKHLKDTMCHEFSDIFGLCMFVLEKTQRAALVEATLQTLLRFLNWIPLGFVFETRLIESLVYSFLSVPAFRNVTLQCLTEIGSLSISGQYDEQFIQLFTSTLGQLKEMLPMTADISKAYSNGRNDEQNFIQNLSLFLGGFLKEHGQLLEHRTELHSVLLEAHHYMVSISKVDEVEIFKICLEYWIDLTQSLYNESPYSVSTALSSPMGLLSPQGTTPRRQLYSAVLSQVRQVMISKMARPEEVLIVEVDGEIIREHMKDTDSINLYKNARECLVYLTHLDYVDTENIMTEKLRRQVDGSEWSWKNLNTLCWAIGSISGAMNEEDEKRFLVTVIKDLLNLCEMKRGKDNKAVVASNIMYIVGQYPRFLRAHWKFLKTVVNKNFEFMHELHEGVQDMACDTLLKIAQKCRRHFIVLQVGEVMPFIEEILNNLPVIVSDLQEHQIHTFYEAVGHMISAQTDSQIRERLIEKFMALPNELWDRIIKQCSVSTDTLRDAGTVKQMVNILRTNEHACRSIGHPFVSQLGRIYQDMLNVYRFMSKLIAEETQRSGVVALNHAYVRSCRNFKRDTLKLIETWISESDDPGLVVQHFIPPLLEAVLGDYKETMPAMREPGVLSLMAAIVNALKANITAQVPAIFAAVFGCTLDMINKDMAEFPEHRTNFFQLLQAINAHCFPAFFLMPPEWFQLVIDSIVWAFKHTMRNVAETGLTILMELLNNFASYQQPVVAQQFYQAYLVNLMNHVFEVLTDTSHKAGFKMQSTILAAIVSAVETGQVTAPLFDMAAEPPGMTNGTFLRRSIATLLTSAFPHLQPASVERIVIRMFETSSDLPSFKNTLRDFLVQIKEFGEDNNELYLEEQEELNRAAAEEARKRAMAVPGMLNPHQVEENMDD